MMGDIKFLDTLRAYDKDNIPQVTSIKILIVFRKQKLMSLAIFNLPDDEYNKKIKILII
jgi:hypothetical protein